VGKNKLQKFAENETFDNLFQPSYEEVWRSNFYLKGSWNRAFFKNNFPIVLELGCGKGEYTVNLARLYPEKNFIGVDIKGARLWRGAKEATQLSMPNVAFIRTRIEHIASFFSPNEVSEIWITFPDPQPRPSKSKKRLTSSKFLSFYQNFLKKDGVVHLKTDSQGLFEYTKEVVKQNGMKLLSCTSNLYKDGLDSPDLSIKTFYEKMFLEQGMPITYISFELDINKKLKEPSFE
jgi:tRNA (guanine-N7-)-methyltransferase